MLTSDVKTWRWRASVLANHPLFNDSFFRVLLILLTLLWETLILVFSFCKWSNMVRIKDDQQDGRFYLYITQPSQRAISLSAVLFAVWKPRRCRPSSHLLSLRVSPFVWRNLPMMARKRTIYKACTMIGPIRLPSFLCSRDRLSLGRLNGGWAYFCVGSLPTLNIHWEWIDQELDCSVQCLKNFSVYRQSTPLSILTTARPISCALSVRVGVPPPTPFTLYPGSCRSPYGPTPSPNMTSRLLSNYSTSSPSDLRPLKTSNSSSLVGLVKFNLTIHVVCLHGNRVSLAGIRWWPMDQLLLAP